MNKCCKLHKINVLEHINNDFMKKGSDCNGK